MNYSNSGPWELIIIMLVLFQLIYYIPSIFAMAKKMPGILKIFIINLLAGWTFVGWVATLIWVIYKNSRQSTNQE